MYRSKCSYFRESGFVALQMIGVITAGMVLAGALGYAFVSLAKSNSAVQLRTQSGHLLEQAKYTLATNSSDIDIDGIPEPPAGETSYSGTQATGVSDGWLIPSTSGAPKRDAWGNELKYCAWDNGTTNSSTGRLSGDKPAMQSSIVLAVVSGGPDKIIQTSCIEAKTGTIASGSDDGVRTMTVSQINQGVGGTVYFGDAVPTAAALGALGTVQPGQMRIALDTGKVYVNLSGAAGLPSWTLAGGASASSSGGVLMKNTYADLLASDAPAGTLAYVVDSNLLYVNSSGTTSGWMIPAATATSLKASTTDTITGSLKNITLGYESPVTNLRLVTLSGQNYSNYTYQISTGTTVDSSSPVLNPITGTITGFKSDGTTPATLIFDPTQGTISGVVPYLPEAKTVTYYINVIDRVTRVSIGTATVVATYTECAATSPYLCILAPDFVSGKYVQVDGKYQYGIYAYRDPAELGSYTGYSAPSNCSGFSTGSYTSGFTLQGMNSALFRYLMAASVLKKDQNYWSSDTKMSAYSSAYSQWQESTHDKSEWAPMLCAYRVKTVYKTDAPKFAILPS